MPKGFCKKLLHIAFSNNAQKNDASDLVLQFNCLASEYFEADDGWQPKFDNWFFPDSFVLCSRPTIYVSLPDSLYAGGDVWSDAPLKLFFVNYLSFAFL